MEIIHNWLDIADRFHQQNLLLGNGASIAIDKCFQYNSLLDEARSKSYITTSVDDVFTRFAVADFELVLRRLWQAKEVNSAFSLPAGPIEQGYKDVQDALINTVQNSHVSYTDAEPHFPILEAFLKRFDTVLSLNYDLTLYWATQTANRTLGRWFVDCFVSGYFDDDWSRFKQAYGASGRTLCFYPHGNLIFYRYGFSNERKISTGVSDNLLDAIFHEWKANGKAPLFVSEGTKDLKLNAISSSYYLEKVYFEVIPDMAGSLVIYGWGMGDHDEHIIDQIMKSQIDRIAVSVFGGDQTYIGNVKQKLAPLNLSELVFFDAQSAGCWINP
ncbi:DUF4917 family protein [Vibrio vulnificus]|nr:DUF4917 family protein [Vibrio vulnificus]ELG5188351.1 DUF4917 family protein [Vibrio vulnificus]ELP8108098.1 DUF4917 family protein [Vibrio vulnificus]ELR8672000.1 DUF4917 family protein [Vibrio vulnificus]ELR8758661.1 DUF4917 family protein [Vibrio vulnificus]